MMSDLQYEIWDAAQTYLTFVFFCFTEFEVQARMEVEEESLADEEEEE